ncbi:beta strand repeat-containing protein [Mesorhizobium sp. IMUNJ 23232]|uniref:beta strand repeat-containing protein n=1 Tax=Mesorhizobium sp. IMUNJ 23232 TaxID=3376064 RepID=UPI0037A9376C
MPSFTVAAGTTVTTRQTLVGNETGLISKDINGILAAGILQVGGDKQTIRFNGPTDGATVTNEGAVENTNADGRAIRFNAAVGNDVTATINNKDGAVIKAIGDAIQVEEGTVDDGVITINNTGSITSTGGQSLDFGNTAGKFSVEINNTVAADSKPGVIASVNDSAIKVGANGTIFNQGTIDGGTGAANSDGVDGIDFQDGATGTVTNMDDAGGSISGDRHGINAGEGSTITVTNGTGPGLGGGMITGRNGSGVGSDGDATVFNYGTITGSFTAGLDIHGSTPGQPDGGAPDGKDDGDGDGIDVDGKATIENYGVIQGTGAGGTGSDGRENTSEGIAAGGGSILNDVSGTIKGLGLGILIDDSSRGNSKYVTTIVNDGIIEGENKTAIEIISTFADTIINAGSIESGNGIAILFGNGNNTLFIKDGSVITGVTDGEGGIDILDYGAYSTGVTADLGGSSTGLDLLTHFENLYGSAQDDGLTGDFAANILNGRGGNDQMAGLGGDDTFIVDSASDVVTEAAGGGTDRVGSGVSYALGAGQEIELLTTTNAAAVRSIDLRGNELAQTIIGNNGKNVLHDGGVDAFGKSSADTLIGGDANDTYAVYNAADVIVETTGQGNFDRVSAGISYVLGKGVQIESLTTTSLHASYAIDLTGNDLAQQVMGNDGNNRIDGKGGIDTILTGLGSDTVVFSTALGAGNVDTVSDFNVPADTVELDDAVFAALATGTLAVVAFRANASGLAEDADDRIIYETDTGNLFYDADGVGGSAGVHFATLTAGLALDNADFVIA